MPGLKILFFAGAFRQRGKLRTAGSGDAAWQSGRNAGWLVLRSNIRKTYRKVNRYKFCLDHKCIDQVRFEKRCIFAWGFLSECSQQKAFVSWTLEERKQRELIQKKPLVGGDSRANGPTTQTQS